MKSDATKLFALAVEADEREDLLGTISYLEQGLALDPSQAFYWGWLGSHYNEREQYGAAIDAFERAIRLDANSAGAYFGLGQSMEALGRLEEAERAFQRSIELDPSGYRYVLLGNVQSALGHSLEAETSFRYALQQDANDEEAMFNLALLIRERQPEEAVALLRRAIELDADYAEAYSELGFTLAGQDQIEEAERSLREAVRLNPEQPWSRIYLGNVLTVQGRDQEAAVEFSGTLMTDIARFEQDALSTARRIREEYVTAMGERDLHVALPDLSSSEPPTGGPGSAEITMYVRRHGDIVDAIEFHVHRGGVPAATPEELESWLRATFKDVLHRDQFRA